jgi:uncharacterized protein YjbI with pentapeptide repeats
MNANHRSPQLQRRSFRGQNLSRADFIGADLRHADFTDAILDYADLSHADLRSAKFRRCSLVGANLQFSRSGIAENYNFILRSCLLLLAFLSGLSIAFVGSSTTGLLINESAVFASYQKITFLIPWHTFTGLVMIIYGLAYAIFLFRKSPVQSIIFGSIIGTMIITPIVTGILIYACQQAHQPWVVIGHMITVIEGTAAISVFLSVFVIVMLAIVNNILNQEKLVLLAVIPGIALAMLSMAASDSSTLVYMGMAIISTLLICISLMISRRAKSRVPGYVQLNNFSKYISTYYGTCFVQADLTDAMLAHALIAHSNLSVANLTGANIYGVQQLATDKLTGTILVDPLVCNLLSTHQGSNENYIGADLQGAYLANADLTNANCANANLTNANLSQTNFTNADLSRVSAAGANLQGANLTGSCIADWSIDRTTQLADVICEYTYLKPLYQERCPASGSFAPGDFTRLFQDVCNTVDLIFHQGINWVAFGNSWKQIQVENAGVDLAIKGIEHKGDGMLVVQVEVPVELDKAKLHQEFNQSYGILLQAVEERYQVELAGRDRELAIYRDQQTHLQQILQSLMAPPDVVASIEQLVVLKLGTQDDQGNIEVMVEIGEQGLPPRAAAVGFLTNPARVIAAYQNWQTMYRQHLQGNCRLEIPEDQVTNLSFSQDLETCEIAAHQLQQQLNHWLEEIGFKPIKELMLQELQPTQSIQIILQTDDLPIRQLPWQSWKFFERFSHAEIALASHTYQTISQSQTPKSYMEVLAIIGDDTGLDLDSDREALTKIPNAQVEFLIEPTRQVLNEKLWSKAWDMIFFAGHSASDACLSTGYLKINATDRVAIADLKYALKQSIEQGLKLVIINSCDGFGLANELLALQLPQAIVMREPVPDLVAQQFLRNFLVAVTNGLTVYQAVRSAREQLQGLEDRYPCASWLPVICQNPAEIWR